MGSQGGNAQQFQFQKPGRDCSPYSLTLNEVQNQLGESLGSMNLDELLRSIFSSEGYRPFTIDLESSSSQVRYGQQGSFNLTRELSKRTVDEVWKNIIQQEHNDSSDMRMMETERWPTLGEMTLEDFLTKAGVVPEVSDENHNAFDGSVGAGSDQMIEPQGYSSGFHWLQQEQQQQDAVGTYVTNRAMPQPMVIGITSYLESSYAEGQIGMSPPVGAVYLGTQTPGRKRVCPGGGVEKTVERKQKRMIKNRESAARSRARKQAYTHELENKISRLEEENEKLKKEKKLDKLLHNAPPPEPKSALRRTSSAPF